MTVTLDDASAATDFCIRELRPGETAVLIEVFDGLTDDQRALRYGTGLPRLPRAHLAQLTATDGERHVALAAEVGGRPVGIARYVVIKPGTAECAIEVIDAFTGRGIARALLAQLRQIAQTRGLSRFTMVILGSNRRAVELAQRAGVRLRLESGSYEGVIGLHDVEAWPEWGDAPSPRTERVSSHAQPCCAQA